MKLPFPHTIEGVATERKFLDGRPACINILPRFGILGSTTTTKYSNYFSYPISPSGTCTGRVRNESSTDRDLNYFSYPSPIFRPLQME
jgi:hypothetical protein